LLSCEISLSGCSRVLGFERASLDPQSVEVSSSPGGDAGDAGFDIIADGDAIAPAAGDAAVVDAASDLGATENDAAVVLDAGLPRDGAVEIDAAAAAVDAALGRDAQVMEPAVPALNCESFCDVVADACPQEETESYAVYDSTFTCLRQCESYALGIAGDDTGNTLACRMTHALIARDFPGERAGSCPAAGPGGDGVCGSNCEGYCALMLNTCDTFADAEQCLAECAHVPDLGGFEVSQNEGNSVQCRLYHLGAALASPTFHCPHASGQTPCADGLELTLH
jgi:hypothetical protein